VIRQQTVENAETVAKKLAAVESILRPQIGGSVKRIYKYTLDIMDSQQVDLPMGAVILAVQAQHDMPQVWALVDTKAKTCPVLFRIVGYGASCDDLEEMHYLGTFQFANGALVFHVFWKEPL